MLKPGAAGREGREMQFGQYDDLDYQAELYEGEYEDAEGSIPVDHSIRAAVQANAWRRHARAVPALSGAAQPPSDDEVWERLTGVGVAPWLAGRPLIFLPMGVHEAVAAGSLVAHPPHISHFREVPIMHIMLSCTFGEGVSTEVALGVRPRRPGTVVASHLTWPVGSCPCLSHASWPIWLVLAGARRLSHVSRPFRGVLRRGPRAGSVSVKLAVVSSFRLP
jgi:hypothetical protein